MKKEEIKTNKIMQTSVGAGLVSAQNNENINTGTNPILPQHPNKTNVGAQWHATRKGITLISLIITIIILLILAGVVLNLAMGNNGIFKLAGNASKNYMNEQEKELADLEKLYSTIQIATGDNSQITISVEDLNKIIDDRIKKASVTTVPAGTVISYITGTTPPTGYLACDGSTYNISDYPVLAESIKTGLGSYNYYGGDGETTFAVPDLRGEFLRGTGTAKRNTGTGATIGIHQNPTEFPSIAVRKGNIATYVSTDRENTTELNVDKYNAKTGLGINNSQNSSQYGSGVSIWYSARPTNTSVLYCIKY